MESEPTVLNPIVVDAITTIVTAFLTVTLVALLPFLQARRKEKQERKEADARTGVIGAEVLEKMTGAFGPIQDFYTDALAVANTKITELRLQVAELEKAMKQTQLKLDEVTKEMLNLEIGFLEQGKALKTTELREQKLKELVTILSNQIRNMKGEPEVTLEDLYGK